MDSFHLTYRPLSSDMLLDRCLQAPSLEAAYAIAAELIADAHGMSGAHVSFDSASGRVSIGAGYRSRRGTYTLAAVATDAGDVSAAGEVRSLAD